jgi:hypothetical protein
MPPPKWAFLQRQTNKGALTAMLKHFLQFKHLTAIQTLDCNAQTLPAIQTLDCNSNT